VNESAQNVKPSKYDRPEKVEKKPEPVKAPPKKATGPVKKAAAPKKQEEAEPMVIDKIPSSNFDE
jgi:hypothetical protein